MERRNPPQDCTPQEHRPAHGRRRSDLDGEHPDGLGPQRAGLPPPAVHPRLQGAQRHASLLCELLLRQPARLELLRDTDPLRLLTLLLRHAP